MPAGRESKYDSLSPQYQLFVDCYTDPARANFNQAEAARQAGYSPESAYNQGWRLMKNEDVSAAIKERLDESAMSAEEALKRLADIARGSVDPFLDADESGIVKIDLGTDEAKSNYNLLRKVKQTRNISTVMDLVTEEIKTEFEIHDAKSALVDILKMHGKFIERQEITHELKPGKIVIDGEEIEF